MAKKLRTITDIYKHLILIDYNKLVKCPSCKLLKRYWQLRVLTRMKRDNKTELISTTVKCPNCNYLTTYSIDIKDKFLKICLFETFEDCLESVSFNPKSIIYVPEEFKTQELILLSKLS